MLSLKTSILLVPENTRWFAFLHWAPHHFIARGVIFCNNWNVFECMLSSCIQHNACQYAGNVFQQMSHLNKFWIPLECFTWSLIILYISEWTLPFAWWCCREMERLPVAWKIRKKSLLLLYLVIKALKLNAWLIWTVGVSTLKGSHKWGDYFHLEEGSPNYGA